jgi:hypothetical protein
MMNGIEGWTSGWMWISSALGLVVVSLLIVAYSRWSSR